MKNSVTRFETLASSRFPFSTRANLVSHLIMDIFVHAFRFSEVPRDTFVFWLTPKWKDPPPFHFPDNLKIVGTFLNAIPNQ